MEGARLKQEADKRTQDLIIGTGQSIGRAANALGQAGMFGEGEFQTNLFGKTQTQKDKEQAAKDKKKEAAAKRRSVVQTAEDLDIPVALSMEVHGADELTPELLEKIEKARGESKKKAAEAKLAQVSAEAGARAKEQTLAQIERGKAEEAAVKRRRAEMASKIGKAAATRRAGDADPTNDISPEELPAFIKQIELNLARDPKTKDPEKGTKGHRRVVTADEVLEAMDLFDEADRTPENFIDIYKGTTAENDPRLKKLFQSTTRKDRSADLSRERFKHQKEEARLSRDRSDQRRADIKEARETTTRLTVEHRAETNEGRRRSLRRDMRVELGKLRTEIRNLKRDQEKLNNPLKPPLLFIGSKEDPRFVRLATELADDLKEVEDLKAGLEAELEAADQPTTAGGDELDLAGIVAKARKLGRSDEEIKAALAKHGVPPERIENLISGAQEEKK
jgi:hypothetical protein